MSTVLERTWAEIDLDAVTSNYREIARRLRPGCRVLAVVKADAYGHGAGYVSRALKEAGASWFGVSSLDEALQIRREGGITEPILILGYTPPGEAARLARHGIVQTVFEESYAEALSREAVRAGVSVRVHIKLDTGMSRIGFFCQSEEALQPAAEQIARASRLPGLISEGIFTHFASSDEEEDGGFTQEQFSRFRRTISLLEERGVRFSLCHCCNSAATLRFPEMHLDLVRPGLILYGLAPAPWMDGILPLRPAMQLKTVISMTKTVPPGTVVSYGRQFTAQKPMRLATVPVGYADGYPRSMGNRAEMLVRGRRARVAGRVCMDQCMLDISEIPDADEGATVTVFGRDGRAVLPVEEFSALSGTINYETVCLIGKRVPRVFLQGGKAVGRLNYLVPPEEENQ